MVNKEAAIQHADIFVEVKNLKKSFGKQVAVNEISFDVLKGEFLTILGPSGCGKTTTLRCIAGFEFPEGGEITIGSQCVTNAKDKIYFPPEKRDYGMVFQSYAIWPHMTVGQNVAYGLKMRKVPRQEIEEKVQKVLDLVGLKELRDKNATMLSGGQQQRVAVARALSYDPKILLFDEPLSNLDAKLRERMRIELKQLQSELSITTIYVTHDQVEAMVMSDRVVVMHEGKIQQIGPPKEIYLNPKTQFVADFIGTTNLLNAVVKEKSLNEEYDLVEVNEGGTLSTFRCKVPEGPDKKKVVLSLRPEDLKIYDAIGDKSSSNFLKGKLTQKIFMGNIFDCRVMVGNREIRVHAERTLGSQVGQEVYVAIAPEECLCLIDESQ